MTRKHYEAIAAILFNHYCRHNKTLIEQLADYFEQDNPKFQRTRFLAACGIEQLIDYHPLAHYKDCATNEQLENTSSKHYNGCKACGYSKPKS